MKLCTFVVIIISLWGCRLSNASDESCGIPLPANPSVEEDGTLSMVELVTKYGYPIETYSVQTEDGYLLTMYRIPYGQKCGAGGKPKIPVLLQHGLLSSSFDYLILGPKNALGYMLADDCYDVWLGNNRGNSESRKHVSLKPNEKKFWAFSWHEMGMYDLPAMIDHVLNVTNQPNLHYVGHSQGTTQFFVFGALRPEYHHKIRTMQALSPVAFMNHLVSPLVRTVTAFSGILQILAEVIGVYEIFPNKTILNLLGSEICKNKYPELQGICCNVLFLLCGFDEPQVNKTLLPAIIGHTPAGAGIGPIIHYSQGINSGEFRQFDYGEKNNIIIYNSKVPPRYPVEKIQVPMALYYGQNDFLAALKDIKKMIDLLPNVIENYLVPYSQFNHMDFIFGIDVKHLLYYRVLEVLRKN